MSSNICLKLQHHNTLYYESYSYCIFLSHSQRNQKSVTYLETNYSSTSCDNNTLFLDFLKFYWKPNLRNKQYSLYPIPRSLICHDESHNGKLCECFQLIFWGKISKKYRGDYHFTDASMVYYFVICCRMSGKMIFDFSYCISYCKIFHTNRNNSSCFVIFISLFYYDSFQSFVISQCFFCKNF